MSHWPEACPITPAHSRTNTQTPSEECILDGLPQRQAAGALTGTACTNVAFAGQNLSSSVNPRAGNEISLKGRDSF